MRLFEFVDVASNIPQKYPIDDDTGLALNPPNQWSQSPYLGAVKSPSGNGYIAQIHIPQEVWSKEIEGRKSRWQTAPDGLFNYEGRQRPPIRVKFDDPRKAAWFVQNTLYGEKDPSDIIIDWLDEKYGDGNGSSWKSLARAAPNFDGEILTSADEREFFANKAERDRQQTVKTNTVDYNKNMPAKIKQAMVDFYMKNKQLAKKRLGISNLTPNKLNAKVDELIADKGVDYFLTAPGSIKIKDIASLTF